MGTSKQPGHPASRRFLASRGLSQSSKRAGGRGGGGQQTHLIERSPSAITLIETETRVNTLVDPVATQRDQIVFTAQSAIRLQPLSGTPTEALRQHILALEARHAAELDVAVQITHRTIADIRASTSWRVTRPLRGLKLLIRRLGNLAQHLIGPDELNTHSSPPAAPLDIAAQTLDLDIQVIAQSGLFDEDYYSGTDAAQKLGLKPIAHYLIMGEARGLKPSSTFDPEFYKASYPDVAKAASNVLVHYIMNGRSEGRWALPIEAQLTASLTRIRADRRHILLMVNDAEPIGTSDLACEIVSRFTQVYDVIILIHRDGQLRALRDVQFDETISLPKIDLRNSLQAQSIVQAIIRRYEPLYVIALDVEVTSLVPHFERSGTPTVVLVNRLLRDTHGSGALNSLFAVASSVVFSAQLVADLAKFDHLILRSRTTVIQPWRNQAALTGVTAPILGHSNFPLVSGELPSADGSLLVIGIGAIASPSGAEHFIAAAASVLAGQPRREVHFCWIEDFGYRDDQYLTDLRLQIRRCGLERSFSFVSSAHDHNLVLKRADLYFLSARQEAFPNTAIDAALQGVPIICFDQASGLAELLKSSPMTSDLVVPFLNSVAVADLVIALAGDQARLKALGSATRALIASELDVARYVDGIDRCGRAAADAVERSRRDASLLAPENAFNANFYLGPLAETMTRDEAIAHYLHASRLTIPRGKPTTGLLVRRPLPGFHPLIYASECALFDEARGEDPLVHYIRSGRPDGPWSHRVITGRRATSQPTTQRAVLHGHFHYPELLEDLIVRLRHNRTKPDLLLTTTSEERAEVLAAILQQMNVKGSRIIVTPNRGRDIAPLLTSVGRNAIAEYDIVGHVHGKRSPHANASYSDGWRNFAWEHLVGGQFAMMDRIIEAMATDASLGLVFPEDPYLHDWDENRDAATKLGERMGLDLPLPVHIDFPIGTMFWARPAALQALQNLGLEWPDFPPEPLPLDGSMLHALERILPFSARKAGLSFATTVVDGSVR